MTYSALERSSSELLRRNMYALQQRSRPRGDGEAKRAAVAEWLTGQGNRPVIEGLTELALDRAHAFYQTVASVPGALAAAGLRDISPDGRVDIHALGRALDPGDFSQLVEKIVLYAGLAFGFWMLYWGFRFLFTVFG